MKIRSGDFTNDERVEACEWVEYSVGWPARDIRDTFTVEPEMPGSIRLTFDRWLRDPDGNMRVIDYEVNDQAAVGFATEPFTIFASARLGWLQRYLDRTGRHIDDPDDGIWMTTEDVRG